MDAIDYTLMEYTTGVRIVDMMGRFLLDLFSQDRYLLNRVDMKVRLVQSKDASALTGAADQDYKIVEAALFALKAKLIPAVQMCHIRVHIKGTIKYPLRSVDCKVFSISRGAMQHTHDDMYLGVMPERVVLCFIDNDTYNGAYD